ncbi:MAG: alanine--glyoxylate aminotransferase family protein [Thermoplasmata archaeon]|nr:alanine--glyoxylate aminotransferase family protein [Thermoplasmata archaeon]
MDLENNLFMLPGPVKMHPRVLAAMAKPAMAHRSAEFKAVNKEIKELLYYLFQTKQHVTILSGSGTAGLDAAIGNLLRKGDKVLNITNGKFSERFNLVCKIFADPTEYAVEWGKAPDLDEVARLLEENEFKAVTLCHNETSTALTNPAKEIGALCKKHGALLIMDGITSVGSIEVRPDEWGVDICLMGSQKCIAAPAGLAGLCVSERAYGMLHNEASYYLDLKAHIDKLEEKNDTPWTPAVPLYLAFLEALRMLKEEGLENRIARCHRLAEATRAAEAAMGLRLLPDPKYASDTVTGAWYPEGVGDDIRGLLRDEYGLFIAGAQAHVKGKMFRIGHMGIAQFTELAATFAALEAGLYKKGYKDFELGAGVAEVVKRM